MWPSFTFNSDQSKAAAFVGRILLFLLPLLAGAVIFETMLFQAGENWPVRRVVDEQEERKKILYSRHYFSQQFNIYKLETIRRRKPDLLIVGSSRVMQFRDLLFRPLEGKVYNAGGILRAAEDLAGFASLMKDGYLPRPKLVLIGVDPWWFKKSYTQDYWLTPQEGFRFDGSLQYTPRILKEFESEPKYVDRESPPIIERVRNKIEQFALPAEFDSVRARRFVEALLTIQQMGIEVAPLLLPLSTEVLEAVLATPEFSGWWQGYLTLEHMLSSGGLPPVAAYSPATYGLDDRYMFDGVHASEVLAGHMLADLWERSPAESLLRRIDIGGLRRLLHSSMLPLSFEPPD